MFSGYEHLLASIRIPVLSPHPHKKMGIAAHVYDPQALESGNRQITELTAQPVQTKRQASDLVRPCLSDRGRHLKTLSGFCVCVHAHWCIFVPCIHTTHNIHSLSMLLGHCSFSEQVKGLIDYFRNLKPFEN